MAILITDRSTPETKDSLIKINRLISFSLKISFHFRLCWSMIITLQWIEWLMKQFVCQPLHLTVRCYHLEERSVGEYKCVYTDIASYWLYQAVLNVLPLDYFAGHVGFPYCQQIANNLYIDISTNQWHTELRTFSIMLAAVTSTTLS